MDLRRWFLLNDLPTEREVDPLIKHVPCSDFRTYRVLKVFAAGYRTGFKLTDDVGQPTETLRVMVSLMDCVDLCRGTELPENVRRAFGMDDPALIEVLYPTWYLVGLTDRIKAAFSAMSGFTKQWVWSFLPELQSARVIYREDGKSRRRTCYIAKCRSNWELNDDVYEGLWKWNYDHLDGSLWRRPAPTPNAYGILEQHPSLRAPAGQGDGEQPVEGGSAVEAALLPAAVGGV